jgi:hypothetical protein
MIAQYFPDCTMILQLLNSSPITRRFPDRCLFRDYARRKPWRFLAKEREIDYLMMIMFLRQEECSIIHGITMC